MQPAAIAPTTSSIWTLPRFGWPSQASFAADCHGGVCVNLPVGSPTVPLAKPWLLAALELNLCSACAAGWVASADEPSASKLWPSLLQQYALAWHREHVPLALLPLRKLAGGFSILVLRSSGLISMLRSASPAELALKVSRRHLVGSAGLVCSSWHAAGASRAWDRASFDAGACAAHLAGHPIKGRDDHGRSASGDGAVTLRWAPGRRQVRTEARDCSLWVDSCPRTAARVCAARAPPPTLAPPVSTGCSRGWCCLASVCA